MLSDTEAAFAMMANTAIVAWLKAHADDPSCHYETGCAFRALGPRAIKKMGVARLWEEYRNRRCTP